MKKLLFGLLGLLMMQSCSKNQLKYPETRKEDVADTYFGVTVPDPYRWLENDTSPEVKKWVEEQNKLTFAYLESIPYRNALKKRLTELWNYERVSSPFKEGGKYFLFRNDGLQNQSVLCMMDHPDSEPVVVLDPNQLSPDGTVALNTFSVSHDGHYLAYALSRAGSDWVEVFVRDLNTGKDLDDHLQWVKFSGLAWAGNGFYYSRYDAPDKGAELSSRNTFQKVYFHRLGTKQSEDKLIHQHPTEGDRMYGAWVSRDEKWFVLVESKWGSRGNALWVKSLTRQDDKMHCVAEGFDYENGLVDIQDGVLYMVSNQEAPRYRLLKIDLQALPEVKKTELIPQKNDVLEAAYLAGGKLFVQYLRDVKNELEIYQTDGAYLHPLRLPAIGTLLGFSGEPDEQTAYFTFTSFNYPTTVFRYNIETDSSEVWFTPKLDFNPGNYEVEQVFYTSKDGTRIPMFITYKKGLKRNGKNPTLLYGYGGFNITMKPSFSTAVLLWLENNGIYALANIRGGGEFGEQWHEAGMKLNKQNVFDDFIAAAEYLIDEKYTSSKKLAIMGGSNGGLLIGAVVNQRPDLFRVAIPQVGVMDMLRFHKFTIGGAWVTDYGSSEDSVQFHYLLKYSPLHNIRDGVNYPAILVTTADHDDRVVPAHSFKYIATLQAKYKGPNPVLIRIQTSAGHGGGKPTSVIIDETADIYSFIYKNMGIIPPVARQKAQQ